MNFRKNSKVLETYLNENGVMRFNLNSPENLNALSENMIDLIQNALDKASLNKKCKSNNNFRRGINIFIWT